ncbi:MAG: hypothetical protein AAF702_11870 [Chloroflexota bacterium]
MHPLQQARMRRQMVNQHARVSFLNYTAQMVQQSRIGQSRPYGLQPQVRRQMSHLQPKLMKQLGHVQPKVTTQMRHLMSLAQQQARQAQHRQVQARRQQNRAKQQMRQNAQGMER